MAIELTWSASGSAACFYDVAALAGGRSPILPAVSTALDAPTRELGRFLGNCAVAAEPFFAHLVPLAATVESNRALAEQTLAKTVGRSRAQPHVAALAGLLGDCERAYFAAFPRLVDELDLRSRPLRELWEACGPGLLATVGKLTDPRVIADAATVAVVQPFDGAGGRSYAPYNLVTIEAVLANPLPQLPETVRLAWLLAALNTDLPDFSERLRPATAATIAQIALLPAVLEAAAGVELVRPDDGLLAAAATAWNVTLPGSPAAVGVLAKWWQFQQSTKAPWHVALVGLERLLLDA